MSGPERILLVSNRLPVTVSTANGEVSIVPSAGGLATAIQAWHRRTGGLWIGWPGALGALTPSERSSVDMALASHDVVPVDLSERDISGYYETFSNGVIWPLFHYLLDRVPLDDYGWQSYQRVNVQFADVVASLYRPGDLIWVHDYHLMLLPALLRERLPNARIGFFLHIPFPTSEVFRILPWRERILHGLLGADLIAFHTYSYLRHFSTALLHLLGLETNVDRLAYGGHHVRLRALPIGIDAAHFDRLAREPEVRAEAEAIRRESGGRRIFLGVDRLDYTKGVPRRLLAFERLLQNPAWRDKIRLIQVAVPTRGQVESYRGFRRSVEEIVGRINGEHGTVGALPVHYLYGSVPLPYLVALYLAADVMAVTPLRDGLNLVAKEFVASRVDHDGVLVLSELAGSASELGEALLVNPYDVDSIASAFETALRMPHCERTGRMRALHERVSANTVDDWAGTFVHALAATPQRVSAPVVTTAKALHQRLSPLWKASPLALVLDYDGTLVSIAATPTLSPPDGELLQLLGRLSERRDTLVHVITGRRRVDIEPWLKDTPVTLWAEHGFWRRAPGGTWAPSGTIADAWKAKVAPILADFTAATPGSWLEDKSVSLTWHYRLVDPEFGARQAHELRLLLGDALSNQPVEVREGKKVVEVRLRGVHKGLPIQRILTGSSPAALVAVGDDATDEDMFASLSGPNRIAVHVGTGPSLAPYWLPDAHAVREWLRLIAA